jgi:hypothetical protein
VLSLLLILLLLLQLASRELVVMWKASSTSASRLAALTLATASSVAAVDLGWYAPSQTLVNNLTNVMGGTGVYGFIYNSSSVPDSEYGTYNWCNMPHVRAPEYVKASSEYELAYVELVSRV